MLTTCPQCNFSPEIPEILRQSHICYHWHSVSGISKIMHCGILIDMPYSKWLINDSCSHNYDHAVYSINKDCLYEAKCTFSSHFKQWYSIKSVLDNSFENAIFIFNNNITIYYRILQRYRALHTSIVDIVRNKSPSSCSNRHLQIFLKTHRESPIWFRQHNHSPSPSPCY